MKLNFDMLIVLLSASVALLALFLFIVYLPRLMKKKVHESEQVEINTVVGAFNALGGEIKSLREQLILKERFAALGEVAAGIAHEFRNPMGVIAGYARLLLKGLDETDNRKEIVQAILTEIEEMNSVMEELLKFSKSEPLNKTDVDLSGIIEDVVKDMRGGASEIDFSSSEQISIKGDKTLLRQAVRNLLHNAADAGDKIRIDIENTDLSGNSGLEAGAAGRTGVSIVIKDNGNGISETDFNKIFMPFYTTKIRGTGIGLALVQKIALAHGGSVTVESKEGKGSTFRLSLPVQ
ncbi:MAG: HAMP domain-containing histidine kinase [Nitrospirae bacterium]|nr:HAMP domain-containing histidine kinase [Nitrospirota bacterium]